MKRLFTSLDLILVARLKDILEKEGIPCVLKNEILGNLVGEIPFTETFPELWVQNDSDLPRAEAIKADWLVPNPLSESTWICPTCHEQLDPQFSSCWKCGAPRPDNTALA